MSITKNYAKLEKELQKTYFHLLPLPLPSAKYFNNHRIPATYMNFVLINNAVLVPTYSDAYDKEFLAIFDAVSLIVKSLVSNPLC